MRRNDCEMRLELVERNFRNRTAELTQCLEVSMCATLNCGVNAVFGSKYVCCSEHIIEMTLSKD